MNLKERGVTVGDLLIFIIVLTTIFALVKFKKSNNDQSLNSNLPFAGKTYQFGFDKKLL